MPLKLHTELIWVNDNGKETVVTETIQDLDSDLLLQNAGALVQQTPQGGFTPTITVPSAT